MMKCITALQMINKMLRERGSHEMQLSRTGHFTRKTPCFAMKRKAPPEKS